MAVAPRLPPSFPRHVHAAGPNPAPILGLQVRVRPSNAAERTVEGGDVPILSVLGTGTILLNLKHRCDPYRFNFDHALPDSATQEDVFEVAGYPLVDNCLAGYNSSIFAYGQTGAGKTHTMLGSLTDAAGRGLAPRVFEYLFERVGAEEDAQGREALRYHCRCRQALPTPAHLLLLCYPRPSAAAGAVTL